MKLSPRQEQVAVLIAQGYGNKEIARQLGLSKGTVKCHIHFLLSKLGARNRTEAAVRFVGRA